MKEHFRSYVWRCPDCDREYITKPISSKFSACCKKSEKRIPRQLAAILEAEGIPEPSCELVFNESPAYRWDWAWCYATHGLKGPYHQLAVEIDGGDYLNERGKKSGHHTIKGRESDRAKTNLAAILGWTLLRFTPQEITSGAFLSTLKRVWES